MAAIVSRPFGIRKDGQAVTEYIFTNAGGMQVSVLDHGCIIRTILVPTQNGPVDVVLGHDTLADYEASPAYTGCIVGRYANRIKGAQFTLNGKTYQLEANNGPNHLHGCFSRKVFRSWIEGESVWMELDSPDGEDGFPGNMKLKVRYTLTEDNIFRMEYQAVSDADTLVNLTNHGFFNLDGEGTVVNQRLRLNCSTYLEGNEETCPTGRILPVAGTPMDFTTEKPIGQDLHSGYPQMEMVGHGYDHCYVIDRTTADSEELCARVYSEKTGVGMEIYTTEPGVQLFTANAYGNNVKQPMKGGASALNYGGFALETQHFPCSTTFPEFPTTVLPAGKTYTTSTSLRFSADRLVNCR